MFTQRTTCPDKSNKYYISTKNGGYNTCIRPQDYTDGRSYFNGSVLANCVGYASGRFNEIVAELNGTEGFTYKTLTCNAENFIERATSVGLSISSKPVAGGIMVWQKGKAGNSSDGAGHVAVVEEVIDDNTIKTSESSYGGSYFFNKTRKIGTDGNWGLAGTYSFRGCIINPAVKAFALEPTERNTYSNQILITSEKLRVRDSASLNASVEGYAKPGYYDVLATVEADGFKWCKVEDYYIAIVDGASEYIEAQKEDAVEGLKSQISTLTEENKCLQKTIEDINSKLDKIKSIVA